ncbi:uncharacterized protein RJT21DRAFT_117046 [Scheffersomyces amazonensis]|uniref:uncharacterized protein n=1 Tax=Scheffersomyces amazonensis TaxID=1078765 RepID=UPI00315D472D
MTRIPIIGGTMCLIRLLITETVLLLRDRIFSTNNFRRNLYIKLIVIQYILYYISM